MCGFSGTNFTHWLDPSSVRSQLLDAAGVARPVDGENLVTLLTRGKVAVVGLVANNVLDDVRTQAERLSDQAGDAGADAIIDAGALHSPVCVRAKLMRELRPFQHGLGISYKNGLCKLAGE